MSVSTPGVAILPKATYVSLGSPGANPGESSAAFGSSTGGGIGPFEFVLSLGLCLMCPVGSEGGRHVGGPYDLLPERPQRGGDELRVGHCERQGDDRDRQP